MILDPIDKMTDTLIRFAGRCCFRCDILPSRITITAFILRVFPAFSYNSGYSRICSFVVSPTGSHGSECSSCRRGSLGFRSRYTHRTLHVVQCTNGDFQRLARVVLLLWRNCGRRCTSASIELLSDCVARVDLQMARPWNFRAGQHVYMYIPALGLWTSHPFSAAWISTDRAYYPEKNESSDSLKMLLGARQETTVSFLIQRRDGFTNAMFKASEASPEGRIRVRALAEGPYGMKHFN